MDDDDKRQPVFDVEPQPQRSLATPVNPPSVRHDRWLRRQRSFGRLCRRPRPLSAEAGRRVCRKYHRAYIGRLQQREYDKLRRIVPALSALDTQRARRSAINDRRHRVSKVRVIEETIRYIDQLHRALAKRVQTDDTFSTTDVDRASVVEAAHSTFVACVAGNDIVAVDNRRHDNAPYRGGNGPATAVGDVTTPTAAAAGVSEVGAIRGGHGNR